jgi:excisionase family DNA binding protein
VGRAPRGLLEALRVAAGALPVSARKSTLGVGVAVPTEQRLVYTVEEAAQLLGISRSFAYEAAQRGEIPSMRIGRRILVPKAALERFLASAAEAQSDDQ